VNPRDPVNGARQQGETFESVVLGLHRNKNLVSSDEGIDRHNAEARRAVNDDVVKGLQTIRFT